MVAEVREQVLLGAELVSKFAGDEGCFVVATHRATVCVVLHLRVFHHRFKLCWNLKLFEMKQLLERFYSALMARDAR